MFNFGRIRAFSTNTPRERESRGMKKVRIKQTNQFYPPPIYLHLLVLSHVQGAVLGYVIRNRRVIKTPFHTVDFAPSVENLGVSINWNSRKERLFYQVYILSNTTREGHVTSIYNTTYVGNPARKLPNENSPIDTLDKHSETLFSN